MHHLQPGLPCELISSFQLCFLHGYFYSFEFPQFFVICNKDRHKGGRKTSREVVCLRLLVTSPLLSWTGFSSVTDPSLAQLDGYSSWNLLVNERSCLGRRAEHSECSQMLRTEIHHQLKTELWEEPCVPNRHSRLSRKYIWLLSEAGEIGIFSAVVLYCSISFIYLMIHPSQAH